MKLVWRRVVAAIISFVIMISINISALAVKNEKDTALVSYENEVFISAEQSKDFSFEIFSNGFYYIRLCYDTEVGFSSEPTIGIKIDGGYLNEESEKITLDRWWHDIGEKKYDIQGNEIRRKQEQIYENLSCVLANKNGFDTDNIKFELTEGKHLLTVFSYEQDLKINYIEFVLCEDLLSYSEIEKEYTSKNYKSAPSGSIITVQGENPTYKSSKSLLSVNDRTSASMQPYDAVFARYNCIGSGRWKTNGQWLEWTVDIPNDGVYNLEMRWKQSDKSNDISSRKLFIDGEIPFKEARFLTFPYETNWKITNIGESETSNGYDFYLTKGQHTIRLEATLGLQNEVLSKLSPIIEELNSIYLGIVMVTGPSPDIERDYDFDILIPETLKQMQAMHEKLINVEKDIKALSGDKGQNTASIERVYMLLEKMVEDSDTISRRLSDFEESISALSVTYSDMRSNPLTIDYISFVPKDEKTNNKTDNFFSLLLHNIKQYIWSFTIDYSILGSTKSPEGNSLKVWLGADTSLTAGTAGSSAGRDQAQIIRELVTDDFTSQYDIPVIVQLVNSGSLLPSILAAIGPDVALGLAQTTPVNYALRNALLDIKRFDDSKEILKRFPECASIPFMLDSSLYALPETFVYPMLFYREDILNKCGIKIDELDTWESLLQVALPKLQMKYLEFGVPATFNTFSTLLLQQGGKMYNDSHTATAFNSVEGMAAFKLMTSLYNSYKLDISFNFLNRFRSGQMPLAIQDYTMYNQISVYAPELEGLWKMMPIPGITHQNGEIVRTAACTVTGCGIVAATEMPDEAWEFIKWWTASDTQSSYSQELESVLGTAARNPTANTEARNNLGWSKELKNAMKVQEEYTDCIPEMAGSYYTLRSFDFAFRDVVYEGKDIKATLNSAAADIDNEITEKRREFYQE